MTPSIRSASRVSARSASSASRRQLQTRFTTRLESACATYRLRSISYDCSGQEGPTTCARKPHASPRRGERGKAAFEIADQIVNVLESDVQAHRRPAWRPFRRRADAGAVEWNGQALEAAPRRADAEQAELGEERVDRALRDRFEHDAEQPARAGKIAPPDGVARTAFQRRMEYAGDFGALGKPARDLQPRLMVLRKPHPHGAQPAQAEIDVVRTDAKAERMHRLAQTLPRCAVGRYGAEHHVGMAADIFGGGLDRQIDALVEGVEVERTRPGIVHQHHRAFGVG